MIDSLVFFPVSIFSHINYVFIGSHRIRIRSVWALITEEKGSRRSESLESERLNHIPLDSFSFYIFPLAILRQR